MTDSTNRPHSNDSAVQRVLKAHPFLKGLSTEHLNTIRNDAHCVEFPAGAFILRRGEPADTLYLLWSGDVALGFVCPECGFLQLDTLRPWDVLGWSWMVAPHRWRFDARALTAVGLVGVAARPLRERAQADALLRLELLDRLTPLIAERLGVTQELLLRLRCRVHNLSESEERALRNAPAGKALLDLTPAARNLL